jgi:hypothetical protein
MSAEDDPAKMAADTAYPDTLSHLLLDSRNFFQT